MILNYNSKKQIKESIGKYLDYTETSFFGNEYKSNGTFCGSNRPYSSEYPKFEQRKGREFFAQITVENDLIKTVK